MIYPLPLWCVTPHRKYFDHSSLLSGQNTNFTLDTEKGKLVFNSVIKLYSNYNAYIIRLIKNTHRIKYVFRLFHVLNECINQFMLFLKYKGL